MGVLVGEGQGKLPFLRCDLKKKKTFVPHMHFLAKLELQSVWDLVVNLSEEIVECKSVSSKLRKLKSLDTKKQTLPL